MVMLFFFTGNVKTTFYLFIFIFFLKLWHRDIFFYIVLTRDLQIAYPIFSTYIFYTDHKAFTYFYDTIDAFSVSVYLRISIHHLVSRKETNTNFRTKTCVNDWLAHNFSDSQSNTSPFWNIKIGNLGMYVLISIWNRSICNFAFLYK